MLFNSHIFLFFFTYRRYQLKIHTNNLFRTLITPIFHNQQMTNLSLVTYNKYE